MLAEDVVSYIIKIWLESRLLLGRRDLRRVAGSSRFSKQVTSLQDRHLVVHLKSKQRVRFVYDTQTSDTRNCLLTHLSIGNESAIVVAYSPSIHSTNKSSSTHKHASC